MAQRKGQHQPVHAHVLARGGLAEDVGPLQVLEGGMEMASALGEPGGVELGLDMRTDPRGKA